MQQLSQSGASVYGAALNKANPRRHPRYYSRYYRQAFERYYQSGAKGS